MAADSAATFTTPPGDSTVYQKCKKLYILGDDLIIGSSGPVGLAQTFCQEIEAALNNKNSKCYWKTPLSAKTDLRSLMWKHAEQEWKSYAVVAQATRQLQPTFSTMIALRIGDTPHLLEFDQRCSPEEATDDLPYKCIGSGQPLADMFLAFTRRVLWPEGLPALQDAVFQAYWAVSQAIEVAPSGLAGPVRIMTLSKHEESWQAKELQDDDLQEGLSAIKSAEDSIKQAVAKALGAEDIEADSPPIPIPPS